MVPEAQEPELLWQEDSAIWEIIAGELVVQHADPIVGDPAALMRRGREHAADALQLLRKGDRDSAGHAMIGCALDLAVAARAQSEDSSPIEHYASEFAATISWESSEPSEGDLEQLIKLLEGEGTERPADLPTLWEVAVKAGAFAAGLSPYITRRRQRRDLL